MLPPLQLHNTLTARKEAFKPINEGQVGLYVCGITPYDETHLGHARCYVVFDILKRVLQLNGYKVRHIQNFTDVDDKIIERALQKGASPLTYAEPFIESFHRYMGLLNVLPADVYPRVTQSIDSIIDLIKKLVARGVAYENQGTVYYSVRKFEGYGRLSKRKLDDLEAGARVEVDAAKQDPLDFALWKAAKPGEPQWASPWGPGRPGWHIECSAMSMMQLGEEFDIHGGGLDLIFPHHENEIAQSVGATGRAFAHTWMHNGFVTVNEQKMSKSLGNFFTVKDILSKFDPMVVRYFLLTQHYRTPLNFSDQELKAADAAWTQRIQGAYRIADAARATAGPPTVADAPERAAFIAALNNDLNTAAALGVMNEVCTEIYRLERPGATAENSSRQRLAVLAGLLDDMCAILGLRMSAPEEWTPEELDLVAKRQEARKTKNWPEADRIRAELAQRGLVIEDTPAGPRLKKLAGKS